MPCTGPVHTCRQAYCKYYTTAHILAGPTLMCSHHKHIQAENKSHDSVNQGQVNTLPHCTRIILQMSISAAGACHM